MAAKKVDNTMETLMKEGVIALADDPSFDIHRAGSGIPQLDAALGGGYAFGRNVLCVGPESTGKTVLAQYAVAAVQAADPKAYALLVDAEMSFDRSWWARSGVDMKRLYVSQPSNGEQAVDTIVNSVKADKTIKIIVLDSIATLSAVAVQEKQAGERTISAVANLVNNMYTRLLPVNKQQAVFFAVNQLRDNMNGYDDQYPGGRAQRHNSHIILRTRREGWIKDKEARIGYVMEIHIKKNKLGAPETIIQLPFLFGDQVDMVGSYIDEAIERGIITVGGPYYTYGETKWLGKGALRMHFTETEADFIALKLAVETAGAA